VKAVQNFAKKQNLNFPLLADADHAVADAYGTWQQKTFLGRKYMGVTRSTFIISPAGVITHLFPTVKPATHPAELLEALAQS
jgi:peroxiredoxin Q/BCP